MRTTVSCLILTLAPAVGVVVPAEEPKAPQAGAAVQVLLEEAGRLLGEKKPEQALATAERALDAAARSDVAGRAHALRIRARSLETLERFEDSLAAWRETAGLWEQLEAGPERIEALCAQALIVARGDPEAAAPLVETAVSLASEERTRPLAAAAALNAAADRARRQSQLLSAQRLSASALAIGETIAPDSLDVATSLHILGGVAGGRGDPQAARDYYQRALAIRERLAPGSLDVARSLNGLGNTAWSRGDLQAARDLNQRALAIQEKVAPDSLDVAVSLTNLGGIAGNQGDLEAARDYTQRALTIQEKAAPGSLEVARSLTSLGSVAWFQGDLDAALDLYRRALAIQEILAPGSLDVARSLLSLGNVLYTRGELEPARDYYLGALAIREKIAPGSPDVAITLTNLGNVAGDRGDQEAAQDYYQSALAIHEKLAPGSLSVAACLSNLGIVALDRGDLDAARDYGQRALAIKEKLAPDSLDVAITLTNLGNVARARGDMDAAWGHYQRALAIQEKHAPGSLDVAASLGNLGTVASSRGDSKAAHTYLTLALAIQEKAAPGSLDVATTLSHLGTTAGDGGDLEAARAYHERALAIRENLAPGSLAVAASLRDLGRIAGTRGDLAAAEDSLARAWSLVHGERRGVAGDEAGRAFSAVNAGYAAELVQVRLERGRSVAAFETLEQGRAQGLLQLVSERGLGQAGVDPDLWGRYEAAEKSFQKAGRDLALVGEQEAQIEQEVAGTAGPGGDTSVRAARQADLSTAKKASEAALSAYTEARMEQERLLGEVRRSVPGLQPRSFSFEEARRALPAGSVFVTWLVGAKASSVFVIPADPKRKVEATAIPLGETQLAAKVATLREKIIPGDIAGPAVVSASHALFEALFPAEARSAMAEARRVILSPDGPLWDLPFAALATRPSGAPSWLGLDKPLSFTPSLTLLALEREGAGPSTTVRRDVLVVGNPVFARTAAPKPKPKAAGAAASPAPPVALRGERSLLVAGGSPPPPLPDSAREARRIAALYGAEPMIGEAATERAVRGKLPGAEVVHLATHGYFHPRLAMSSGVLLTPPTVEPAAGATDDDGALQAWEFGKTLPLRAQLVVLSGCETGRGDEVRGEGLVGLTRALQGAGARSVVATHWKVADRSTARLMVSFHEALRGGLAKDEALRQAMAKIAGHDATGSPFYWAGFFLTGDADRPLALER